MWPISEGLSCMTGLQRASLGTQFNPHSLLMGHKAGEKSPLWPKTSCGNRGYRHPSLPPPSPPHGEKPEEPWRSCSPDTHREVGLLVQEGTWWPWR